MALQHAIRLPLSYPFSPLKENMFRLPNSLAGMSPETEEKRSNSYLSSSRVELFSPSSNFLKSPLPSGRIRTSRLRASKSVGKLKSNDRKKERGEASSDSDEEDEPPSGKVDDPHLMDAEERREWRRRIREVIGRTPYVEEEVDPGEKRKKMQKLMADYPLVMDEDDPVWPEDSDGWGFSLGQFFDKITIKNKKKDDDDNYDSDNEIVWKDDNYIRPIKDIRSVEWEETVFKDISPLIIPVHHRYKSLKSCIRPCVQIIWNCGLLSPRCVALDAVVEDGLVSALQVPVFPENIFTKAGKILYREREIRTADEFSKIMAFFYYGAAKSPSLNGLGDSQEAVPSTPINGQVR